MTRQTGLFETKKTMATSANQPLSSSLSPRVSFYLLASIIVFFLAASSAPTPLYAIYQARWGFSPITITAVFGIYALAVLASLLTVGALSDYIGRRPVLLAAIAVQALAMLVFASAENVGMLTLARILQGLSTGAAAGAVGAGLLDLDRAKGTIANAISPMTGTATGGLLSGLMVQFLPAPTQLVYLTLFGVFVIQVLGVLRMPELVSPKPGALASLRPQFRVPPAVRQPLLLAAPALIAAWALTGFYGSLGPTLIRRLAGSSSIALGGLALFVMAATGAVTVLLLRTQTARLLMIYGTSALVLGVALALSALHLGSLALFFAGTALSGSGFGTVFQGVIRTIVPLVAAHERAGLLSVLYVISYLAMGLPAVVAGVRLVHGGGDVFGTAHEYGAIVAALAALALLGILIPHARARLAPAVATAETRG